MIEHKSRIFIIEHFARGTALVLCAAYRLNLFLHTGHVFFINPWLLDRWWDGSGIRPPECTVEEMVNISTWTFTVTHQLINPSLLYKNLAHTDEGSAPMPSTGQHSQKRLSLRDTGNSDSSTTPSTETTASKPILRNDYGMYTFESVLILANAVVRLLRDYPSATSILDSPYVAQQFRELFIRSHLFYTQILETLRTDKKLDTKVTCYTNEGQRSAYIPQGPSAPWASFNERSADYWVLRQFQPTERALDIVRLYVRSNYSMGATLPSLPAFNASVAECYLNRIYWGAPNLLVPGDGSETADCRLQWLMDLLRVSCSDAIIIFIVGILLVSAVPVAWLWIFYYRHRLKKAERLIRQPFEQLCAELADLDIPSSDVVLNRHVGQGAFGMVYGGEAKCRGTWEAVAVKVLGSKATLEGKRDFLTEAKVMRELEHKNVVRLIGICLHPREEHLYLIMEVMLLGDLKSYLLSHRSMAQQFNQQYISPKASALVSRVRHLKCTLLVNAI